LKYTKKGGINLGYWVETLINIGIGLGTGYTSGLVVTLKFNKKAKKESLLREISEEKQLMVRYLEVVQYELNLCQDKLIAGSSIDYESLGRLLVEEPRTPSFTEQNLTVASLKHISGARNLIEEIRESIKKRVFTVSLLKQLDSRFIRAKLDILMIRYKN
jgi:hypothetical protein